MKKNTWIILGVIGVIFLTKKKVFAGAFKGIGKIPVEPTSMSLDRNRVGPSPSITVVGPSAEQQRSVPIFAIN
jgi:hypothetical protein